MSYDNIFSIEIAGQERLLWTGRPQRVLPLKSFVSAFVSSITVCAFLLVFNGRLSALNPSTIRLCLMASAAAALLASLYHALVSRRVFYALTDERLIIKTGVFSREIKSLMLERLNEITLEESFGNTGTIFFGKRRSGAKKPALLSFKGGGRYGGGREVPLPPRFEDIEDVHEVHDMILGARRRRLEKKNAPHSQVG